MSLGTNGRAALPVTGDNVVVEVWICATQTYPVAETHPEKTREAA